MNNGRKMSPRHDVLGELNSNPAALQLGSSVVPKSTGLVFTSKVTFQAWESIGQHLLSVADTTAWWIADWLAYGEASFRDRYHEAIRQTSLKYQTLRNYAWVARQIDLPRRRDRLSFGHHAEVAALNQPEQDFWLRKADELGWSRNHLRSEIRASLRERGINHKSSPWSISQSSHDMRRERRDRDTNSTTMNITLSLTSCEFARFTEVAHKQNQEVEEWALQALKMASEQ